MLWLRIDNPNLYGFIIEFIKKYREMGFKFVGKVHDNNRYILIDIRGGSYE